MVILFLFKKFYCNSEVDIDFYEEFVELSDNKVEIGIMNIKLREVMSNYFNIFIEEVVSLLFFSDVERNYVDIIIVK